MMNRIGLTESLRRDYLLLAKAVKDMEIVIDTIEPKRLNYREIRFMSQAVQGFVLIANPRVTNPRITKSLDLFYYRADKVEKAVEEAGVAA